MHNLAMIVDNCTDTRAIVYNLVTIVDNCTDTCAIVYNLAHDFTQLHVCLCSKPDCTDMYATMCDLVTTCVCAADWIALTHVQLCTI